MAGTKSRERLDNVLVARGLAPTRSRARDMIRRGCVTVDGAIAHKAGLLIGDVADITLSDDASAYVSRGGFKLSPALDTFGYDPTGRNCLDIGASTGGFTDTLLQRGAAQVYAVDVGSGQLAASLVDDVRVQSLESTDVRSLNRKIIPVPITAIVADVSFISLTKALPSVLALVSQDAWLIALVKPQFEVGPDAVGKGGIVRDPERRLAAVDTVRAWLASQDGWSVDGVLESQIAGSDGNQEYLIGARYEPSSLST